MATVRTDKNGGFKLILTKSEAARFAEARALAGMIRRLLPADNLDTKRLLETYAADSTVILKLFAAEHLDESGDIKKTAAQLRQEG